MHIEVTLNEPPEEPLLTEACREARDERGDGHRSSPLGSTEQEQHELLPIVFGRPLLRHGALESRVDQQQREGGGEAQTNHLRVRSWVVGWLVGSMIAVVV